MAEAIAARAVAIEVLARVRATDAYLNLVLDSVLADKKLADARDSGLVTELCYGTTRRQLSLDHAIAQFVDRKLDSIEDKVLAALRIGTYQLFFTRIPRHAAVGETVEALKSVRLGRAAGFVNAVLRKLATLEALPLPKSESAESPVAWLALRESHPEWLVKRWVEAHGEVGAERMLVADNQAPPVTVRVNSARSSRDQLLAQLNEAGIAAQPTTSSPVGLVLPSSGRVEELYGFSEGLWQVQDEAAQWVTLFAAIPEGTRVLDACAAPGGKACHLAESRSVVALDLRIHKLHKVNREAARLGLSNAMTVMAHDATTPFPAQLGLFDAVVVDAPCSGLGTLRRHPELRYRRKEEDVLRLAALQSTLLANCAQAVRPGGLLVYAVCSTEPEEGSRQVEEFLRSQPDIAPEFVIEPPTLPWAFPAEAEGRFLRTYPGPEGMDGFFAARFRRRG